MIADSNGDRSGDTRPLWITGLSPPDSWRSLRQPGYLQLDQVRTPKHCVWGSDRTLKVRNFRSTKVGNFQSQLTPRRQSLQEYRVGVLLNDPQAEVEQSYQDAIAELASWLEGEGATVVIGAKPDFPTGEAMEVYTMLLRAATSKRLSDELISQAREDLSRLPSDAIPYRRRMLKAQTMLHRDWLRWNERRYELMVGWEEWFETYDLLLCPAASSPAFPHDQAGERHDRTITVNGRAQPVVDQLFWAGYPCGYYLPSTVAPIGLALGLPVGIQIVGRQYDDLTCLHMAGLIEEGYYRFTPPPGY